MTARTRRYLALTATKLLETGELEQRVAELEAVLKPRKEVPKANALVFTPIALSPRRPESCVTGGP